MPSICFGVEKLLECAYSLLNENVQIERMENTKLCGYVNCSAIVHVRVPKRTKKRGQISVGRNLIVYQSF